MTGPTWPRLVGVLLVAVAIGFALWWMLVRPQQLAADAGQARVEATLGTAGATIANGAIAAQAAHTREIVRIETRILEGENEVRTAAGADAPSTDVARALRAAVCLSAVYAADPDCAAVRGAGARDAAAGADRGSTAPD